MYTEICRQQKDVYFYVLKCPEKAYYSHAQKLTIFPIFDPNLHIFWFHKVGSFELVADAIQF